MGVTNRHLLLLEVNLNKQKSKHYDDSRRNYRCPSRRGGIDRRDRSPNPRRWQEATTTKEGQESQERQKKAKKAKKGKKKAAKKSKKARKARKSRKVAKKSKKARKGRKVAKKSK